MIHKKLILIAIVAALAVGCSAQAPSLPDSGNDLTPKISAFEQTTLWNWGSYIFSVDDTHTRIEMVPVRESDLHYNVTKFVEGPPCSNCLKFGPIQQQGDGTFKIEISLRHPFLGQLQYTGFDVRGTVVFPATHYWWRHDALYDPVDVMKAYYPYLFPEGSKGIPLFFSHSSEGGAMVLNPDGYSFYLFPGMKCGYDIPICKYQKGKYATDTEELDSTINPFIEFHSHDPRRMFLPYAEVSRTYHIKPTEGPFKFGYIVDASWCPPDVLPVTNPAADFPPEANAEDPVSVEFEQIAPLENHKTDGFYTRWVLRHRENEEITWVHVISPLLQTIGSGGLCLYSSQLPSSYIELDDYTTETKQYFLPGGELADNPPGKYLAVALATPTPEPPNECLNAESTYYNVSHGYLIVELELVE